MARKFKSMDLVTTPRLTCRVYRGSGHYPLPHQVQWQTMLTSGQPRCKEYLWYNCHIEMRSEAGAGAVHCSLGSGALTTTYTASQASAHASKHVQDCWRAASWCFSRQRTYQVATYALNEAVHEN